MAASMAEVQALMASFEVRVNKRMEQTEGTVVAHVKQHVGSKWDGKKKAGTPWTAAQNQRGRAPWLEVEAAMSARGADSVSAFIAAKARDYTASYYAFDP